MDWASESEVVRRRAAELGDLVSDSQSKSIAPRFFVRGCKLTESDTSKSVEKTAGTHRAADQSGNKSL